MPVDPSDSSIRPYRSKKTRPCDNCRLRRQRCVIPGPEQPCSLCVATKKDCTFVGQRRTVPSDRKGKLPPSHAQMGDHTHDQGQGPAIGVPRSSSGLVGPTSAAPPGGLGLLPEPHWPALSIVRGSFDAPPPPAPLPPTPSARTVPLASITAHVLAARATARGPGDDRELLALDDDATEDEELYLVGTAIERDAVMLNVMAGMADVGSQSATAPPVAAQSLTGIRLRTVSPHVHFVYYKSRPYEWETGDDAAWDRIVNIIGPADVPRVMANYFKHAAMAIPMWSDRPWEEQVKVSTALKCLCLCSGTVYSPSTRHLHRATYTIAMDNLLSQSPRARLWTLQAYIMDLDGRQAINPSGNFVVQGQAISIARLLGLHEDCTTWRIPTWERSLRTRIWWSILNYDRFSALTFGRERRITQSNVPIPPRSPDDSASYDAFVSSCELSVVIEGLTLGKTPTLAELDSISLSLDRWKTDIDTRELFRSTDHPADPGVKSLQLLYLGTSLTVVRAILDALSPEESAALRAAQQGCLAECDALVSFVGNLSLADLDGYWSCHSPFVLSLCLTLLVRVVLTSHDQEVRHASLTALRRLVSSLAQHHDSSQWDIGALALARAQYFIPLLAKRDAEFSNVLQPLQSWIPEYGDSGLDSLLQTLMDPLGVSDFLGSIGTNML